MALLALARAANLRVEAGDHALEAGSHVFGELEILDGGRLLLSGAVNIAATTVKVHKGGSITGKGRSSYTSTLGPGTPSGTAGCTWNTGDYNRDRAASHGGLGAYAGDLCTYGSTFFPSMEGSSGNGGRGGAALQMSVSGELWLDGTIDVDAGAPSTDWSGGSGGSAWITTSVLRGSGGVVRADGGNYNRYGSAGGGGGRIALHCDSSQYDSVGSHGYVLPGMHAYGGVGASDSWDGGCGTVYIDCGNYTKTLLLDNGDRDTTPLTTSLVDDSMTTYEFDTVRLLGGSKLGFAPKEAGESEVVVSIKSATGDKSGTLSLSPFTGRTQRVVALLSGRMDGGAFVYDTKYQASAQGLQLAFSLASFSIPLPHTHHLLPLLCSQPASQPARPRSSQFSLPSHTHALIRRAPRAPRRAYLWRCTGRGCTT